MSIHYCTDSATGQTEIWFGADDPRTAEQVEADRLGSLSDSALEAEYADTFERCRRYRFRTIATVTLRRLEQERTRRATHANVPGELPLS